MERHYQALLQAIGEDPHRKGLQKTPQRAAEALKFITDGYQQSLPSIINGSIFECDSKELIILRDIEFYSLCEHHLLPFFGRCHIGYLPDQKILGLSKLARIVDHFSHRLQLQEYLTQQIADCIQDVIQPAGVGVIIEAKHLCMMMRGVAKQQASMVTSTMLGILKSSTAQRAKFFQLIRQGE